MEDITKEPFDHLKELVVRSINDQARFLEKLNDVAHRIGSGEVDAVSAGRATVGEVVPYLRDLWAANFAFFSALADLNQEHTQRFFDRLSGPPQSEPVQSSPAQSLHMHGVLGSTAEATVSLENKGSLPVDVSFLASGFVAKDGRAVHAVPSFDPPRPALEPGDSVTVRVSVVLDPAVFAAGEEYRARIMADGRELLAIELTLSVLASPAKKPVRARTAKTTPPTRKPAKTL